MSGIELTPLGASARFYAPTAERIEVCLFNGSEEERVALTRSDDGYHHGSFPGWGSGQVYGLRTHGPWRPADGLWHDPRLLLVDPFARAISGDFVDNPSVHHAGPRQDTSRWVPRSVLVDTPRPPRPGPDIPWSDTVIYETHVRSLTMLHPDVPRRLRGTYLGAAAPSVIEHLGRMGITTVELMPVAHHVTEPFLQAKGLGNHWGYSTLGWYAPHAGYATSDDGRQVDEFVEMVDRFHEAGLEVVVDVVFNHTAEGGREGPILSMKGLNNQGWYRLENGDYVDWTGTGNTVDTRTDHVRQSILDALRWWSQDLGVDGFRFDLGVTLGRGDGEFDPAHLAWLTDDPVLERAKLIAEPWDLGPGGFQLGHFGGEWREWNGRFRDDVRDFWRGKGDGRLFCLRVGGSPDVFGFRSPAAAVNMVASHDGFTLADLVAYDIKHNEANGEGNRDGHDDNRSWNSGHEGPTDDPVVSDVRHRRAAALLATTLLAAGVPMVLGGDELGATHLGNNNAYALDELNWYDWSEPRHVEMLEHLSALRRRHGALRHGRSRLLSTSGAISVEMLDGTEQLILLANASSHPCNGELPAGEWEVAFASDGSGAPQVLGVAVELAAWTILLLRPRRPPQPAVSP